ncbi:MAG: VCBS repeat-containing protein [Planctomycetota bacterium]
MLQPPRPQSFVGLLAVAIWLALALPVQAQCVDRATSYGGGDLPRAFAAADVTGDGNVDLVMGSSGVSVLAGDGSGGFEVPRSYATSWTADALSFGDLDLNGTLDILPSRLGATVSQMLLLNGSQGLVETLLPDPGSRRSVVGDFNNDGLPDFAANVALDHEIAVFLGDGIGGFARQKGLFTFDVWEMVAADFDANGHLDVATIAGSGNAIELVVHLGDGLGGLSVHASYAATTGGLATVDIDGNGTLDLISGRAAVRLGTGTGTFGAVVWQHAGGVSAFEVADFDGDGDFDVAVADDAGPVVTMLFGNGAGVLAPAVPIVLGVGSAGIHRLAAADFDGNGTVDLAHLSRHESRLTILSNSGAAVFATLSSRLLLSNRLTHLATEDFDGDGSTDLVCGLGGNTGGTTYGLALALGDGAGGWSRLEVTETFGSVSGLATGDFDGDGATDVVAATSGAGVRLFTGDGTGNLTPAPAGLIAPPVRSLVALDLDADGDRDVVVAQPMLLHTLINDGFGGFTSVAIAAGQGYLSLVVGDFDGNGQEDVAHLEWDGTQTIVVARAGDGLGGFLAPVSVAGAAGSTLRVADLNEDGRDDLVVQPIGMATYWHAGDMTNLLGTAQLLPSAGNTLSVVDVDDDGHVDLLVDANVHVGDGMGNFTPAPMLTWATAMAEVQAEDLNGDGVDDLVARAMFRPEFTVALRGPCPAEFVRGACNADAFVDVSDAVWLLHSLFDPSFQLNCPEACDVNDDEVLDMSDGVQLLQLLFGLATLPAPFPDCGLATSMVFPSCTPSAMCP